MSAATVTRGDGPVILGQPHGGTFVPTDIAARLNSNGKILADTDWHINDLYADLVPDLTVVSATFHRYVIDANRDPTGDSLYPGQNTTGLCPLTDFDGAAIWKKGREPSAEDVAKRIATYHAPYHAALSAEIERVKARHGFAILYDCHSIRSRIPFLFDGTLPDLNIGTDNGKSCDVMLATAVQGVAESSRFSTVTNGRFRGGWTTRHYGQPLSGVHAIQMEIAQSAYLESESPPWSFSSAKALSLQQVLAGMLEALVARAKELPRHG